MAIKVGCCGYPVSMKKYRNVFKVVELNRTFYRYPKDSTVERWRRESSIDFEFTVKAHQEITHKHRFKSDLAAQAFDKMKTICRTLKACTLLFQTPASFTPDYLDDAQQFFNNIDREGLNLFWETRGEKWEKPEAREALRKVLEQLTVPSGENVTMKSVAKEIFVEADKPVTLIYVNNDGTYGYGAGLSFMGLGADQKALVYVPTDPTKQESYIFTCEETVVTIDSAPVKLSADSIFPLSAGLHEIAADRNVLIQSTYWAAHTTIQGIQSFAAVIPAVEMVNTKEEIQLKPMISEESDPSNYLLYIALAVVAAAVVGVGYCLKARRRP